MEDPILKEALTFDDLLLVPRQSEILPDEVDLTTQLTPQIQLKIPLVSSPMDTVTEGKLAIALARLGGIGIVHRSLSIEEQAEEIDKVKRSESGMITDPITLGPNHPIADAEAIMSKYHISGIPIIKEDHTLVGILTNRDIRFAEDFDQPITEFMTHDNLITAQEGTTLKQAKEILHQHRIEKLPIVDTNNHLKGLITVKDIRKVMTHPHATKDEKGRLRVGAAVGVSDYQARVPALVEAKVDVVVIDSSHGHSRMVLDVIKTVRKGFPDLELIGGNVATSEGATALIKAGVDAVRVGMGPGSICTTRIVSGMGVPQMTAIFDCVEAARPRKIPAIADGGIKYSGDITKAIAAGAATVMIGGLFAGTDESPGEIVLHQGERYKQYRGMGSLGALKEGSDRYTKGKEASLAKLVPEGVEGIVNYKGPLELVVDQLVGGLKAGMGYLGAASIDSLQQKARFVKITPASRQESHPHSVSITKEAPNYSLPRTA